MITTINETAFKPQGGFVLYDYPKKVIFEKMNEIIFQLFVRMIEHETIAR